MAHDRGVTPAISPIDRSGSVLRAVLILPSESYRADFVEAAAALGVQVIVASDVRQAMSADMGERAVVIDLDNVESAVSTLRDLRETVSFQAVVGVDEKGVEVAAAANQAFGFRSNTLLAVQRTRNKVDFRKAVAAHDIRQPAFALVPSDAAGDGPEAIAAVESVGGFPVVVKPLHLSGSQGVIRVDGMRADGSTDGLAAVIDRVRAIACAPGDPVLIEQYVDGIEVAVEGLLRDGSLEVLAVFDKPDPLVGPYFEETIYVTPSRLDRAVLAEVEQLVWDAARAIGLTEGPIHGEVRIGTNSDGDRCYWLIEVAARSIGGLCGRTLRFGLGITLEQILLRHALNLPMPRSTKQQRASGVMMLPIDGGGRLVAAHGVDQARSVVGVEGVEITVAPGSSVVPLPEGDRYLGFLFAAASDPAQVEAVLREASSFLHMEWDSGS